MCAAREFEGTTAHVARRRGIKVFDHSVHSITLYIDQ